MACISPSWWPEGSGQSSPRITGGWTTFGHSCRHKPGTGRQYPYDELADNVQLPPALLLSPITPSGLPLRLGWEVTFHNDTLRWVRALHWALRGGVMYTELVLNFKEYMGHTIPALPTN